MNSLPALNVTHAVKCELAGEILRSYGTLRLRVMGWSMLPTVWPGDTLVIERAGSESVSEGDIVLFCRERQFVAHRVVAKNGVGGDSKILTRGDATLRPDPPLSDRDLLGIVRFILRKGTRVEPSNGQRLPERALVALLQRSEILARVIVGIHGMLLISPDQNSTDRVVPCQS